MSCLVVQIIEEVYHADKDHDDAIDKEEFRGIMKSFKVGISSGVCNELQVCRRRWQGAI